MKRLIPIFLILCLLLCACNGDASATPTTTAAPTTEATTPPTTEATVPPTTEAPTEPPVLYRHPLTGEPLDEPFTGRVVTFTVNNIAAAMPQHGISQADILYEITVEGGATRCLAVFTDLTDVGPIGSIRSARTYFVSLSKSYNAVFVHSGKSSYAQTLFNTGACDHVDADPAAFYRDSARQSAGYAYEHTHFTTGEKILALLNERFDMTVEPDTSYGLGFVDEQVLNGETANTVQVNFGSGYVKTTTFTYDESTGSYAAYQHGEDYIDGNTEETLHFENLLVLYAVRTNVPGASGGNVYHELVGGNSGYYISGGQMVPINWTRASDNDSFVYTLEDGSPLNLIPGQTYIGIIPTNGSVVCE